MTHSTQTSIKVATDAVIFTMRRGELMVLLIQMKKAPYTGKWAIPGGLIEQEETTEMAARRILRVQTGLTDAHLEQLATFDDPTRDALERVVSVAYIALVTSEEVELKTTEKYAAVRWWPVRKLPSLAYDHRDIMKVAVERLRAKLAYTNIVWNLLPKEFPLSQLQEVYQIILGHPLDKRNFRRKILSLNLLTSTGKRSSGGAHRPAELYNFRHRRMEYIDVL